MARAKKDDLNLEDFKYVDCFAINPQTGHRSKWERHEVSKVDTFRQKNSNYNVFCTVQTFKNKVRPKDSSVPEIMYAPLFFDIDSSMPLADLLQGNYITASEIDEFLDAEQKAHITNMSMGIPLPVDIIHRLNYTIHDEKKPDEPLAAIPDPDHHIPEKLDTIIWLNNLNNSRQDAVKLVHYFTQRFNFSEDEVRVYFSGKKGFHIIVDPILFGIRPSKDLNRVFKFIAHHLENSLGLEALDSFNIYSKSRMFRLIDSLHHKSGLFKVELYHRELKGDLSIVLKNLAKAPRGDLYPPEDIVLETNTQAHQWFYEMAEKWQAAEKIRMEKAVIKDEVLAEMEGYPACVQDILNNGIKKSGDRNKATMALASYFKDCGNSLGEAIDILVKWAEKIPKSMTASAPSEVRASTISCTKTIYEDPQYHFGCAFIRSLKSERKGSSYEMVQCAGRACPASDEYQLDKEPAEFMHLAKTANAEYTGKKVSFNALVSGKLDTPYIVPKKVRFVCGHEPFCDKDCIMHDYSGVYEREFNENERFLIEATNQNDTQLKSILKAHSFAACNKVSSSILEYINISEFLVVPMAERIKSVKTDSGETISMDETGNEYVTRKTYGIGNEIQTNTYYNVEGYVYSHPKNAMATVLSQKHTPLEDTIAQFTLTEDIRDKFSVFQVQEGETLDDRVTLIINDLVNITGVRERPEPHLALLMTYHSCLNYYFQGALEKRGWLEVALVGDSGQAKCANVCSMIFTEDGLVTLNDYLPSKEKGAYVPLRKDVYGMHGVESTSHIYVNGYNETIKIGTDCGYAIEATPNHPIMVMNKNGFPEWRRTDALTLGDRVLIQRGQNYFGKGKIPKGLGKILGMIVGDGCYSHRQQLLDMGLDRVTAADKEVPKIIRSTSKEGIIGFLQGYFETDGYWNNKSKQWEISSKSELLIEQVQLLLLNLGVVAKRRSFSGVKGYENNVYWELIISSKNARIFNDLLGYNLEMPDKINTNKDLIPYMATMVDGLWKKYKALHSEVRCRRPGPLPKSGLSINTLRQVRYGKHELSYEVLDKLLLDTQEELGSTYEYKILSEIYNNNFYFDTVTSLEKSEAFTADFTVPNTHSFFANGFLNHNTQLVDYMMEFCGLGNSVSGEGSSRTGLVYKLEQLGERWFLTWGVYPLSDRRLLKIDEFSEMSSDDFGKLTEARTSGVLKVDRVVTAETNARVRLVLLTNPVSSRKTLSNYTHGCESLKPLFASPADIRRLDLAVFLKSGDVPKSVLNKEYPKPEFQLISSDTLRDSILWAWSRRADQIQIDKAAMKAILRQSDILAEKYGYANDIPLMEPADLRKKLARMSIALAALVHSTNESHEVVVVQPEHVDYAVDFISVVYDNKNCRLDVYSAKSKEELELTEEERETVQKALANLDFGDNATVSEEIIDLFRKNDIIKPQEIIDMTGFERSQVNARLAILTKHSMIKRTREGLRKLPKFIEFLDI